MGMFWCETCGEYWCSFTPETVSEHNIKHENKLKELYELTEDEDRAIANEGIGDWLGGLERGDKGL